MKYDYPVIIKFHEKYSDAYYIAETDQQLYDIANIVLTERYQDGWYPAISHPGGFDQYVYDQVKISLIEIDKLQKDYSNSVAIAVGASTWIPANQLILQLRISYDDQIMEMKRYEKIASVVEDQNGEQSWGILKYRNKQGYQYETFDIINPIKIK